jgi:plastocyanin
VVVLCGCREDAAPRGVATPLDPTTLGSIRGIVAFAGVPPAPTSVEMYGDAACTRSHPGAVDVGDVRIRDGRVGGAFVYVEHGLEGRVFELPMRPVTIAQRDCLYSPRVIGVQTGQPIEFINDDPTLHNVHTQPRSSSGANFGMAVRGARRTLQIGRPEVMVVVRCDVHPWMRAFVGVLDHPYFAVSAEDGSFLLVDLPAGTYTVTVWHERLGTRSVQVTVKPRHESPIELRYAGG